MVKMETQAPPLWQDPPQMATPSTLDKRASPSLYRLVWCDNDLGLGGADGGFVAYLLTRCDRNP